MKVEPSTSPTPGTPPAHEPRPASLRWLRIKEVFLEALDRPPEQRSDYVARACAGDVGLLREVESLLASDDAAADFCETPAAALLAGSLTPALSTGPRLAPGAHLGAYEIISFIAAGGMGDVYRARHALLGREVALKTVNAGSADGTARRRLLREAKHAAQLKHSGICTIHEVGECDGAPFIVMEYVAGLPLNDLVRERVPALDAALDYGIQVANALAHAHNCGIVHRDLKSSNVMVDGSGRVIVLDFGLARRLPGMGSNASLESTVTQLGALAGTLSHMPPEVLLGGEADVRSDIWALGVLLYELVAGELPFRGRTPYETTSAILSEPFQPLGHHVPLALRLVIERCLMKQRESRYQSAGDVAAALDAIRRRHSWPLLGPLLVSVRRRTLIAIGALAVGSAALLLAGDALKYRVTSLFPSPAPVLALLPLTNATGDPTQQYYADGMSYALTAQLGAATDIRIISPASAARVERSLQSPTEIAQRLGATAIVQGTMRRVAGDVLVDLWMVRSADGRVLWRDRFRRTADEVLVLQADVVRTLALEVRLTLRAGARERLASVRSVAPEVYEAYLQGRYEWNQRTPESLQRAIAHFSRAVELDPSYAPAHAALADCYSQQGTVLVGTGSPREYRPRAQAEAIKALQLDPNSAEAHAALGYVRHYDWQWTEAEREFRRALELNPSYSMAHIWYANLLMSIGRMNEALRHVNAARELDPFSLIVNTNVGWVLDASGRRPEAVEQYRRTLALDSTYLQARWRLAGALLLLGRIAEAREQVDYLMVATDRSSPALAVLATYEIAVGHPDSARAIVRELLARARTGDYIPPHLLVGIYRGLGDYENSLAWATKAFEERSNGIAYARGDTVGFGADPRYRALMARVGFP